MENSTIEQTQIEHDAFFQRERANELPAKLDVVNRTHISALLSLFSCLFKVLAVVVVM